MKKYWYFGVRMKKSSSSANGLTKYKEFALFEPTVFDSAEQAANACAPRMAKHPGLSYFIQGYDHKLDIDKDGYSHGFVQEGA